MATNAVIDQNSIVEADFYDAKNLAYGCLSAMNELYLACGSISAIITKPFIFVFDNITLLPPDQEFSRITRAVEFLCKVLDSSGVPYYQKPCWPVSADWNDSKTPDRFSKVKTWLLMACKGEASEGYNTEHEKDYRLAFNLWFTIEYAITIKTLDKEESDEPRSNFQLELESIEKSVEEIRKQIRNSRPLDFEKAKNEVDNEFAQALALWKAYRVEGSTNSANMLRDNAQNEPISLSFDEPTKTIACGDRSVRLSPTQFYFIKYVFENGKVSFDELQDAVWKCAASDSAIRNIAGKLNIILMDGGFHFELVTRKSRVCIERIT